MRAAAQLSDSERAGLERLRQVADTLRSENPEIAAVLDLVVPLTAEDAVLRLGMEPGFVFEKQLTRRETAEQVEAVARTLWNPELALQLVPNCREATPDKTLATLRTAERERRHAEAVSAVKSHPAVQRAIRVFDARIKEVRISPSSP